MSPGAACCERLVTRDPALAHGDTEYRINHTVDFILVASERKNEGREEREKSRLSRRLNEVLRSDSRALAAARRASFEVAAHKFSRGEKSGNGPPWSRRPMSLGTVLPRSRNAGWLFRAFREMAINKDRSRGANARKRIERKRGR